MVLRAAFGDLDRTEQGREPARGGPIHVVGNSKKQARPVRIAATGGIEDARGLHGGNGFNPALRINPRTLRTLRDDERFHQLRQLLDGFAGALLDQFRLVVVGRNVIGLTDEIHQVIAIEQGQALPRIENEGHAGFAEFARMLQHALAPVGRDDAEPDILRIGNVIEMREVHRPRMECRDLVVVEIGGDEGLGREGLGHLAHVRL